MAEQKTSKCFLYSIMLGMLISGSANTLILKYQNDESSDGNLFTHPYFQTWIMFLGELTVFGAYGVKKQYIKRQATQTGDAALLMSPGTRQAGQQHLKLNCNPLIIAIPATCDFCASTLMFIALTMVDASIYQMMRGIIVVITALLAWIFLGKKQYRHHWTAIVFIIAGVAEVGWVAIALEGGSSTSTSPTTGIILLMIS